MKLFKSVDTIFLVHDNCTYNISEDWDRLVNRDDLYQYLMSSIKQNVPVGDGSFINGQSIKAPIASQEIWAAGVTYMRSKEARIDEAKLSAGSDFYAKVYEAERPEFFFKP